MRKYSIVDLIKFKNFAAENPELKNHELIKQYNINHPAKTAEEKIKNIAKELGLNHG